MRGLVVSDALALPLRRLLGPGEHPRGLPRGALGDVLARRRNRDRAAENRRRGPADRLRARPAADEQHALDPRSEVAQTFVDPLVSAVDLADVADLGDSVRAQGGDQHRHPGPDVG